MKKLLIILFVTFFSNAVLFGQCGNEFFTFTEGTEWEMSNFDKKGKLQSKSRSKIVSLNERGGEVFIEVEVTVEDEKGQQMEMGSNTFTMSCKDGVIHMDFSQFVPSESFASMPDTEVTFTGDNLEYPSSLRVGQTLKDANVNISVKSVINMNMNFIITDRVVMGKETITTSAGSFDCFKINSTTQMKSKMINSESSSVDWVAKDVGTVRSESFNKKGRSQGYSELTYFKKG